MFLYDAQGRISSYPYLIFECFVFVFRLIYFGHLQEEFLSVRVRVVFLDHLLLLKKAFLK